MVKEISDEANKLDNDLLISVEEMVLWSESEIRLGCPWTKVPKVSKENSTT